MPKSNLPLVQPHKSNDRVEFVLNSKNTYIMRMLLGLLASIHVGCGDENNEKTKVSGIVTSMGNPVADSRIVAMNRISNSKHTATTDKNGRYELELENGFYDIGADDSTGEDSSVYGLVALQGEPVVRDFALPVNIDDDQIEGVIYIKNKEPAASHIVDLKNAAKDADGNNVDLRIITAEDGRFTASIPESTLFDLEIRDPDSNLIEHIDLHKLSGALYAEITLGTEEDNNVHRFNQNPASESPKTPSDDPSILSTSSTENALEENTPFHYLPCFIRRSSDGVSPAIIYLYQHQFSDGSLEPDGGKIKIYPADYAIAENFSEIQKIDNEFYLYAATDGAWFYKYAVHIRTNKKTTLYFTDATNDTYTLGISVPDSSYEHTVSYDSTDPKITKIMYKLDSEQDLSLPACN